MQVTTRTLESLREFNNWKHGAAGAKFDLLDFVCCEATPDLLFGFAELFYPELVLHDSIYFIASKFGEEAYETWRAKGIEPREIQRVMNHIHMDLLLQSEEVSVEVAREAAQAVATIWCVVFHDRGLAGEVVGEEFHDLAVTLSAIEDK